jgi:hypothetical protein
LGQDCKANEVALKTHTWQDKSGNAFATIVAEKEEEKVVINELVKDALKILPDYIKKVLEQSDVKNTSISS